MAGNNKNLQSVLDMIERGSNPKEVALNLAQSQMGISPEQFVQTAQSMGFRL